MKLFILFIFVTSCLTKQKINSGVDEVTKINILPTEQSMVTTSKGKYCSGTTNDGQTDGFPLYNLRIRMAGHIPWIPNNSDTYISIPQIKEAHSLFQSSDKLHFRLRVNSIELFEQNVVDTCDGVLSTPDFDFGQYEYLSFQIKIKKFTCHDSLKKDDQCEDLQLSETLHEFKTDLIKPEQCSSIYNISSFLSESKNGVAVTISKVTGHKNCDFNKSNCELSDLSQYSCWDTTLQVSTDVTGNFL